MMNVKTGMVAVALGVLSLSTQGLAAASCDKTALEVAKLNLDAKAKAYGFSSQFSSLVEPSLTLRRTTPSGSSVYTVGGKIYKGLYSIRMRLDSSCGVEAVLIAEILEK